MTAHTNELYDFRCDRCDESLDRSSEDRLCLRCWIRFGSLESPEESKRALEQENRVPIFGDSNLGYY